DTTLPSAWDVAPPGIPAVTESLYETRDSAGVKAKATITYAASPSPFVHHYVPEYRLVGAPGWVVLPNTTDTTADVFDVTPGRYEVRVKAVSHLGAASAYATAIPKEVFALGARPADVTGLTLQTVSSLAVLRWDPPAELDVRIGGRVLVRHSESVMGATWETSYSIGEPLPGASTMAVVPLKAGTYLVKAEDSSGLTSVNEATFATKNASVLSFSSLATVQEDGLFAGTHAGTFAEDGILKLSGAGLFDDIPDFDSVNSLDAYGGVRPTGTYTFASGTDLGAVGKVRVETSLDISAVNINDRVDSRYGMIDDWLDFDGTLAGGSVDVWVEARETDDDPAGTPAWGDWGRVDAADYDCRALQYRAVLTSADPAYNVNVSRLRVSIKEVT
ncbi:MAG TPA: hypothetical protein VD866_26830, partial [Urbifossiella sp.]|nr:hypothetical protein [Urbifossiella sp.]